MFTTSRYYGERLPGWLRDLAREHAIEPRLATYAWTPRDAARLARETGLPDRSPAEPGKYGLGPVFPHLPREAKLPAAALVATPLGDEVLLEAALAALDGESLGRDEVPDLLCVRFSSHDHIGHGWGLESWESTDQFARLDAVVARLLDALDALDAAAGRWCSPPITAARRSRNTPAEPTSIPTASRRRSPRRPAPLSVQATGSRSSTSSGSTCRRRPARYRRTSATSSSTRSWPGCVASPASASRFALTACAANARSRRPLPATAFRRPVSPGTGEGVPRHVDH
jgi:hypothetical protein